MVRWCDSPSAGGWRYPSVVLYLLSDTAMEEFWKEFLRRFFHMTQCHQDVVSTGRRLRNSYLSHYCQCMSVEPGRQEDARLRRLSIQEDTRASITVALSHMWNPSRLSSPKMWVGQKDLVWSLHLDPQPLRNIPINLPHCKWYIKHSGHSIYVHHVSMETTGEWIPCIHSQWAS